MQFEKAAKHNSINKWSKMQLKDKIGKTQIKS